MLLDQDVRRDVALIRSAIDLGHALGMRVVAEGIERLELVDLLVELGCDRGQGFAIRPPTPARSLDLEVFSLTARSPARRETTSVGSEPGPTARSVRMGGEAENPDAAG